MSPRKCQSEDFENPDAPEEERRLRADHIRVRDLSYDRSRMRQILDLAKGSFIDMGFDGFSPDVDPEDWPKDQLEIYVKEKPRGPGYIADLIYNAQDLPVTVHAVLVDRGQGLEVAEFELFRMHWGCDDGHGNYLHPDDQTRLDDDEEEALDTDRPLITSDLLRRIPLGAIVARTEARLADTSWLENGVIVVMGPDKAPEDLTESEMRALTTASTVRPRPRGRPTLSDEHLENVARAYLEEATQGVGLTRRLAARFDRPEPTIRDWVAATRSRGYLSKASPGRRGASAGPKLHTQTMRFDATE